MQAHVEVRYAGVVVARASEVRKGDRSGMGIYLPVPEPLPVGTTVELRAEGSETVARVERVIESANAGAAGMFLRLLDANAAWALAVATSPDEVPGDGVPAPIVVDLSQSGRVILSPAPAEAPAPAPVASAPVTVPTVPLRVEQAPAPTEIPSAFGARAPTVVTPAGDGPVPGPIPSGLGDLGKKTLLYGAMPRGEDELPVMTPAAPTEELPPARPLPASGRRATKRRRK